LFQIELKHLIIYHQIADFRKFIRESANPFIILCSKFDNSTKLQQSDTMDKFLNSLLAGSNNPPEGTVVFDSSDHVRFQNGQDVSGHNLGCNRRLVIEKNIEDGEGYTITMYNLDGIHPLWKNNVQMAPKRMKIISVKEDIVEFRGFGYDENALAIGAPLQDASFENYGIVIMIEDAAIVRAQLNMYDRNISIVYLK
jgi:hypothetical protein